MLKSLRFAVLMAGVTLGFTALAQPAPPPDEGQPPAQGQGQDQADPPSRVARLSFIKGAVSFVPAGENDWVEAQMNRPLITGDKLWTDNGSRAELEIGSAAIRMDAQTSFDFLNLDDNTAQMELTQGSLNLRVRRLYDGQTYEVDTPTLAFVVNRVGEFRIDVQPDGQTTIVSVNHGGGDVYGEGGARFHVDEGQSVTFADPQLQNYQSADLPQPDDFDQFVVQRDRRWDDAPSKRYVAEETIGYQDLDDYGSWSADVPEYGNVWYPSQVEVGWSPYHYGHWAWVGAYGWSWVDDAPWGFAPFHYGRWAYINNRWGWCPGAIVERPVYAPALVAFVGGGVAVGISAGPIGWFPLGYHDVYFPAYHVSRGYFTNVNVYAGGVNVTVVNNYWGGYSRGAINYADIHYANRGIGGAVVAVPAATFVGARPVGREAIRVDEHTFANGGRVSGFAAVAPTRASLVSAPAARAIPAAAVAGRPIVAATRPPAPVASFATRQALLAKNPGQPLAVNQLHAPVAAGAATTAGVGRANNVRVVTQGGAPLKTTTAPTIAPRTTVGNPAVVNRGGANGALPAVQRGVTPNTTLNSTAGRPGVTTNNAVTGGRPPATGGAQTQRFNSANFAHPNATTNSAAAGAGAAGMSGQGGQSHTNTGVQTNSRLTNTGTPNPATRGTTTTTTNNNLSNTRGTTNNGAPNTRTPIINNTSPTTHAPTNTNTLSTHTSTPTNTNSTNSRIQSGGGAEYHRGSTGNTSSTPQTYHPSTGGAASEVHTQSQVQTQHNVTPQTQNFQRGGTTQPTNVPHNNPPPPPPANHGGNNNNSKNKDDDKHGH